MKKEILKLLYKQIEALANKFIEKFEGRPEYRSVDIVVGGFLKFIYDELEIL